jgi:hypothetical protein
MNCTQYDFLYVGAESFRNEHVLLLLLRIRVFWRGKADNLEITF